MKSALLLKLVLLFTLKNLVKSQITCDKHEKFEFNVTKQIKGAFGKNVNMKKGTYLVIEHTEALHVIDVNSGNRSNRSKSQEETAMEVNLIAASEIARQLRLRDMGGIIVVDFIDLNSNSNRKKLFEYLTDPSRINIYFYYLYCGTKAKSKFSLSLSIQYTLKEAQLSWRWTLERFLVGKVWVQYG